MRPINVLYMALAIVAGVSALGAVSLGAYQKQHATVAVVPPPRLTTAQILAKATEEHNPAVLVATGRDGTVRMQEFSSFQSCGEAMVYIEIGTDNRVRAHCVAR